jgi:hypothetical protein
MTNTLVVIRDEMGLRVPSVLEVAASDGASVTFKANAGVASVLFFSPAAVSILTPKPHSHVPLAGGAEVTYTFEKVEHGVYGVITQAPGDPAPTAADFAPAKVPAMLSIQPSKGTDFPTPTNTVDT